MLSRITWPMLTMAAGSAGMGVGVMFILLNRERDKAANKASFVQTAVNKLREQPAATTLLGDSFEVGRVSLQDGWGKMDTNQIRVRVPIIGTSDKGSLYVYARKKDEKAKYKLYKLEMTFDKLAGKKLILMDLGEDQQDDENGEEEEETATVSNDFLAKRKARIEELTKRMEEQQKDPLKYHPTLRSNRPTKPTTTT